ncbi:UNVERIFIED_CONTAM: Retrovirus-related Pol polyprotein from transposon TNT 1-94 [Sesamum latifolium]|uniref:Retrovirus-related Pol polyprotein from transposon TNT 1-94 n=1 Tax=Sesamum latifolium TaxID=2727402 RepID=A0AAW2X2M8_9LAMI
MVEDRSVAEQTHEIINLEHALADAEMKFPEMFLVMSIVDKFFKSWENFGMTLKHQKGRLCLDDLMIAISIEEEHRNQTHKIPVEHHPWANLIVGKQKVNKVNSNSKAIGKGKTTKNKKPKANKPCWNCGQVGHWAKLCPNKKTKTGRQLSTWLWEAITGRTVSTENSSTAEVLGIGSVDLKFPSGRVLSLKRVHHVSTVRRNIISGSTSYALRFLVIKSEISGIEVNKIVEFRDAVFIEDVFPMKTRIPSSVSLDDSLASTSIPEHMEKMTNVGVNPSSTSLIHEESDEPRRSKKARVVKDFESDFVTYNIEDDPITFKDAMASSETKQWKEAVKSEMDSIVSNGTWKLVDLPRGCTTIVLARLTTIRVLIALVSVYSLPIHQMDVKTALLYGELEEKIYMDQPEGFAAHGNERKVCKLVKSLYGLKQAPKQWHKKFDKTILMFGFTVNENDKCIYCKVKGDKIIILCLYVDDILLIGSCVEIIIETKSFLKNKFEMKDMGEADVILGIKLIRSTDGIAISQSHYVEKIIEKFGYQNSRIAKTPYDSSVALFKNESGISVAQLRYSQIIGSLQYLANGTRPDIFFSISKLARYTSCPDRTHWSALDRVLRYLKGTVSLAIHYGRFPVVLEGYSDASWIDKNSESNGCSGYIFTLDGGAVSWKSAK